MSYPPIHYYWPQGYPSSHAPAPSLDALASSFHFPISSGPPLVGLSGATRGHQYFCSCRLCANPGTRHYANLYAMAPPWEQPIPRNVRSPVLHRSPFLHRLLDGTRDVAGDPPFQVDMRAPVLTINRRGCAGLPTSDWNAPATEPMLDQMRIVCDVIPKWPIDILVAGRPMTPYRPERPIVHCLIVSDILCAVHASLQTPITREEWARLSQWEAARVSRAFKRRCDAYADAGGKIRRGGILRVDFLAGRCRFRGLVWRTPANGVPRAAVVLEDV